MKKKLFSLLLAFSSFTAFAQKDYNILNYSAQTTARYSNEAAIQKAIDGAAKNGGGRVIIPAGNFVTGPIVLKTGVELHLEDEAVLLGGVQLPVIVLQDTTEISLEKIKMPVNTDKGILIQ